MATLEWSGDLALGLEQMDQTHIEFVQLLRAAQDAEGDARFVPAFRELVEHTAEHFAQEDRWMRATGFAEGNCHTTHHAMVLGSLREGLDQAAAGDCALARDMAAELGTWFPLHAQSMDSSLAAHLREVGFDPETAQLALPEALPAQVIHGCGGACSTPTPQAA